MVAIVGPNGAGKTTLLRAILGLARLPAGAVTLFGRPAERLSDVERATLAAYLPQDRHPAWNLAAWRVAALGATRSNPAEAERIARSVLAELGVGSLAEQGVLAMSGGERARVLIARLLATAAPLLVADEPTAGLDPDAQILVQQRLRAAARAGACVLVTLHDLTLAARTCDRVVVLSAGRIAADGAPTEALRPEILSEVFGLDGSLVTTDKGLVLAADRAERRHR
jgi:iron complex transport system ATP-binding protein